MTDNADLLRFAPMARQLIEANAEAEEKRIIEGVLDTLEKDGALRPEFAIQQWIRLAAARDFLKRLNRQQKSLRADQKATVDARIGGE